MHISRIHSWVPQKKARIFARIVGCLGTFGKASSALPKGREKPHLLGAVPYYGENHVSTDLLFGNLQMIKNQICILFLEGWFKNYKLNCPDSSRFGKDVLIKALPNDVHVVGQQISCLFQ